jgi:tetratricopeptide (TPR) repeat protein
MTWIGRGLVPERRSNERHFRLVQAVVDQNQGLDLDQLNELLNSKFTGSIDDFDYPSETAFDRAENLCYEAMDNYGRRRIQLARQAVQEDPTHVEANNLLAESAFDLDEKIERFKSAVEFGRQHNKQFLQSETGNFWEISQTRPFIRALYGLAVALESQGKRTEAIDQLLEILRLNTNDNLGARYVIMPLLLNQNRDSEALAILERYREQTASWLYLSALIMFRKHGKNSRASQLAIEKALQFNPHVIELLSSDEPPLIPEDYQLQSPDEAANVIEEQMESWLDTEEFIDCLFKQYANLERQRSKRKRDRLKQQRKSKRVKSKRK